MNIKSQLSQVLVIVTGTLLTLNGCSSMPGQSESGRDLSSTGPNVINAKTTPQTVELNRNLQPIETPSVTADVKDFNKKITEVNLKFVHVPIQVPMENIEGTTWRGSLTAQQLQMLAVTGKTMKYEANIIAKNEAGQTAITQTPITISVKAPEISTSGST